MSKELVKKEMQERLTEIEGALARARTDEQRAQRDLDAAMTFRDECLQLKEQYTQVLELMQAAEELDEVLRAEVAASAEAADAFVRGEPTPEELLEKDFRTQHYTNPGALIMTPEEIRERREKTE